MLSSFGIRANPIFMESFFSEGISEPNLNHLQRAGAATLFGQALVLALACVACTMCVAVALISNKDKA